MPAYKAFVSLYAYPRTEEIFECIVEFDEFDDPKFPDYQKREDLMEYFDDEFWDEVFVDSENDKGFYKVILQIEMSYYSSQGYFDPHPEVDLTFKVTVISKKRAKTFKELRSTWAYIKEKGL